MAEVISPGNPGEVGEAIAWAIGGERKLEVRAGGTKRSLGRPVAADVVLDVSRLSRLQAYEPEELVLTAEAATPLGAVEAALAEHGQQLAFEPPDLGSLYGLPEGGATLGGVMACNLSGPRRVKAFAARDHFLGVKAVNGRGEVFKAGGRVVKNVTGYDLCKLLAGSHGTLAVMTEITIKVTPAPEKTRTVLIFGLSDGEAIEALARAMHSSHEVSGAAHLPASLAARSRVAYLSGANAAVTALRVEGFGPSVLARCGALREAFNGTGPLEELHGQNSALLWREIRDLAYFADEPERAVWRLCVPPAEAAVLVARLPEKLGARPYYDWAGGLIWLSVEGAEDAGEPGVRGALGKAGGHALLVRAPETVRRSVPVFQPQDDALAALTARTKQSFDPCHVLNPGRMYNGV
ncbi:MAG: FAD-binding protein [Proteobacteria bacterium]|nr:FAD-binding protein [Pseudomonadota bacterium]